MEPTSYAVEVDSSIKSKDNVVTDRVLLYEFMIINDKNASYFKLQITDPADPSILYDYTINPTDFPNLQREQSLLCDFPSFPKVLNSLLQEVNENEHKSVTIDELNYDGPTMLIQEKTSFKLITQLLLKVITASDQRLNQYLTGEVKKYKSISFDLQQKVQTLQKNLSDTTKGNDKQIKNIQSELQATIENLQSEKNTIQSDYESQIQKLKNQNSDAMRLLQSKYENEFASIKKKYNDEVQNLQQEVNVLTSDKHELEKKVERLNERVANLETSLNDKRSEVERMRADGNRVSTSLSAVTRGEAALRAENEQLKQQILKIESESRTIIQQNRNNMNEYNLKIGERDEKIKDLEAEVERLTQIEESFEFVRTKSKSVIERFKQKTTELLEDKKQLEDECESISMELHSKLNLMRQMEEELDDAHKDICSMENEINRLKSLEVQLRSEIDELEKNEKANQIYIDSLNNQLNNKKAADLGIYNVVSNDNGGKSSGITMSDFIQKA